MEVQKIPKRTVTLIEPKKSILVDKEKYHQKRVAAYCRVSTDSEEQLTSYQNQMRVYTEMIAARKEWEFAGLYADEGISGTRADKRPEFQRMIRDCQNGKIDYIITKSVSRFARNTVECLEYIRSLKAQGIGIFFEEQNIDTLKSDSELYLVIYAGFAQSESESISKHITWTYRKNFEDGKVSFQYKRLLGYRKGEDGKPEIVPEEAAIVERIFEMLLAGQPVGLIAQTLQSENIEIPGKDLSFSKNMIMNILRNEKYCGDVLMQKTYTVDCLTHKTKKNEGEVEQYFIPDHHPAIVEREVWDKAQVRLEQIAGKRRRIRQKQQRLIPLRKGVLLGFVPIRPTWKAVSLKRLETATEKVMALVDTKPEQVHIEYESEECEMEILKGFEVINLKQPKGESVMTVTSNSLKFNKATAVELNYAPYIKVLLNAKTRQIAIQPCSEKDPNAIKFSNEESKQTYAISIKVPAIQVEFRRMLPFEDDNGGKLSYTLNGTLYPDEQVVIYDIGDVKPETEKKRRGRRKKSEIEAEQKEN